MHDNLGIVVIGRNEGDRLRLCLQSLRDQCCSIVYVDSGSSDDSTSVARLMNLEVVDLDPNRPFNAARARHEGFERLMQLDPSLQFVFFIDGDCELVNGWLMHAVYVMNNRPMVAVVCGRRRERYPEQSIYNRICDLEWNTPVGEAASCGGDALMRVVAYLQVGGFDSSVSAGEEPELCYRLRKAGWKILRIDTDMTFHDAAISSIKQWWKRELRTGYGGLDVQLRFGLQDFSQINSSARLWALGWPLSIFLSGMIGWWLSGGVFAFKFAGMIFLLMPLQIMRVAWKGWRQSLAPRDALAYGAILMVSKWHQVLGQVMKIREHRYRQDGVLIEYKSVGDTDSDWTSDLERYPSRPWLKEQSIWAIAVHRFGRRIDRLPAGLKKQIATKFYWFIFRLAETVTGISLPKEAEIGGGLRIHHFGNIFVHPDTKIGEQCVLRHGVTIGNRVAGGPVPVIGNNVEFGAYAQVLGGVTIGDGAKIGAMSVVLSDVPPNVTAVGIPAHVIIKSE